MPDQNTEKGMSRRDFLKMAGTAAAGFTLLHYWPRIIGSPESKTGISLTIDMSDFTDKTASGQHEINFQRFQKAYPDLITQNDGTYIFDNKTRGKVELSFDDLGYKELHLLPQKAVVAKSNIPQENYQQGDGFGEITAGIILKGNFVVGFDRMWTRRPVLNCDGLDRGIVCLNQDNQESEITIRGLEFKNLNDYRQVEGGQDTPAPAYISTDGTNLVVDTCEIQHKPAKPDSVDEVNSQLARGIIGNNTKVDTALEITVNNTTVSGLLWDAIVSNGKSDIKVQHSACLQHNLYRDQRGAGVATTYNTPEGSITIADSVIDYNKGVANFMASDNPSVKTNLSVMNSKIRVGQWATFFEEFENINFENNQIDITKGSEEILPPENEIQNWDQIPMCHVAFESKGNQIEFHNNLFVFLQGVQELVGLMNVYGGASALEDPWQFIEEKIASLGPIGVQDRIDADPFPYWFTGKQMANLVRRAIKEPDYYPTHVVFVTQRQGIAKKIGVMVDHFVNGEPKPSKIFWYSAPLDG